ncbi:MAG: AAA family ATPase [Polyangiaceae bacterium]|nr:AAA family ATPase [Polyangiaceae bacterium]
MITQLTVRNFKCLQDVTVTLAPFTVLIGANDSGKSSLLDAIQVLGRSALEPLPDCLVPEGGVGPSPFEDLVWQRNVARSIVWRIQGESRGRRFAYELAVRAGPYVRFEKLPHHPTHLVSAAADPRETRLRTSLRTQAELVPVVAGFASVRKYRFDPRSLRKVAPLATDTVLSSSGDNLAAALDAMLTGPDRVASHQLEAALCDAFPTLAGVALRAVPMAGGIGKAVDFILAGTRPPVTIPAANASEGALLLTAFLALAHGPGPEILLIEEPENGLHPSRAAAVMTLLRRMSEGDVGDRPRQVILTTHSPALLGYARPEEVRIFRRDPERGTEVSPMSAVPDLERLQHVLPPGDLWHLLTEGAMPRD